MRRYIMILGVSFFFAVVLGSAGAVKTKINVTEDSDVVLPCSPSSKENLESKLFDWKKDMEKDEEKRVFMYDAGLYSGRDFDDQDQQFKSRVSFFRDELKEGNASIQITKTKVSDSGSYSCIFPRLQPSQTFSIQLVVVASSEPYTKILEQTAERALLQCDVRGASPKPVVEWRDSSGDILPAKESLWSIEGNKYFINLQTNVTKTDHYRCKIKQEELKHEIASQIYVYLHGKEDKNTSAPLVFGCLAAGWLAGVTTLAAGLFLAVKNCPTWRDKVIDYLSGLKPQHDFKQQQNGFTPKDGPVDPLDASRVPLQSLNEVH